MRMSERPPCKRPGFRSPRPNPTLLTWLVGGKYGVRQEFCPAPAYGVEKEVLSPEDTSVGARLVLSNKNEVSA